MLRTYEINVIGRGWSITLHRETVRDAIRDVWETIKDFELVTEDLTMRIKVYALSN